MVDERHVGAEDLPKANLMRAGLFAGRHAQRLATVRDEGVKQVVQNARSGELALRTVPDPRVKPGHLLVRTRASLISAGTERQVVKFARKNLIEKARARPDLVRKTIGKLKRDGLVETARTVMARLDEPLPLGYSAAGVVAEAGAGLEGRYRPGQRVAVAGAGFASHAEWNAVPGNLAAPVPDGVPDEEASYATLCAIALHGVRLTRPELGAWCAVIGTGLVGQLAAQLLALSGVRVLALDFDLRRLELAERLGAEGIYDLKGGDPGAAAMEATEGLGCDAVVIAAATGSSAPFETAAQVARDRAIVSLIGYTGTAFPYREFMQKELTVRVSRSYGPGRYDPDYEARGMKYPPGFVRWTETGNLKASLDLMRPGRSRRLNPGALTTHRFGFDRAEDAYAMVADGTEPHLGVILQYDDPEPRAHCVHAMPPPAGGRTFAKRERCVLGVIGAGTFARTMLLPALKETPKCELHTIATTRGISAEHGQQRFGFAHATTEEDSVFDNPEINAVLLATPHNLHAGQTTRALNAGKHVFVEKPLSLTREELREVAAAARSSPAFFQVGFNRRFAPLSLAAKAHLATLPGRRHILLRVNAGRLPDGSWQRDADQGHGRILGEACHFIDLGAFLAGAPIVSVHAEAAAGGDPCEDVTITCELADGSLVTVFYTALGDTAYGKELIEAYAGNGVVRIEDFRRLAIAGQGRVRKKRSRGGQDKGHRAELRAFVEAVVAGGPPPVDEAQLVNSSLATIVALESLGKGVRVALGSI